MLNDREVYWSRWGCTSRGRRPASAESKNQTRTPVYLFIYTVEANSQFLVQTFCFTSIKWFQMYTMLHIKGMYKTKIIKTQHEVKTTFSTRLWGNRTWFGGVCRCTFLTRRVNKQDAAESSGPEMFPAGAKERVHRRSPWLEVCFPLCPVIVRVFGSRPGKEKSCSCKTLQKPGT